MPIPSDLAARPLTIQYVDAAQLIRFFRLRPKSHPTAIHYGKSATNRFDCPAKVLRAFGVTYAAFDLGTCFAEAITRDSNRKPLKYGGIIVSESAQIKKNYVAELRATTLLRLADVTDLALYSLGAEAGEFNSYDYPLHTQPWALELYNRGEKVDGLLYRSRFLNGRQAVAIFERGGIRTQLHSATVTPLDAHPGYGKTLKELGICLVP